jgi:hypothetical protein
MAGSIRRTSADRVFRFKGPRGRPNPPVGAAFPLRSGQIEPSLGASVFRIVKTVGAIQDRSVQSGLNAPEARHRDDTKFN